MDNKALLQRLRRELAIGLEQVEKGQVGPLKIKKIKAEGRKRVGANNSGASPASRGL
jgi:hypothetical protein